MGFVGQNSKNNEFLIPRSGFWPGINVQKFRQSMRILDSVENAQAEMALLSALDLVISELKNFKAKHAEYAELEQVPNEELAGRSRYVFNFERAVFSEAKAKLLEDFRDMDLSRKAGEDRASLMNPELDELRRERWNAVRTFYDESDVFAVLV
ncbi:head completion/stabilization protein [Wohlfahrtiimonas larvae]|uniref:Head completion/stabilization protein n=1 Tax=Wohlfahrtiimonas larvae TaxID=1157986 RepID=A0ABP9MM78_9GAMM|nr:head completion/stabilization protein [Wohlfahrtiimonas larvae]